MPAPVFNAMAEVKERPQMVHWKRFILKQKYHLELILARRGYVEYYDDSSGYIMVPAEVLEDATIECGRLVKGDIIIVGFASKTYNSAYQCLDKTFRKQFKITDNLKITFVKESKQSMTFTNYEIMVPTKEQQDEAEEIYAEAARRSRRHREVIKQESEIL